MIRIVVQSGSTTNYRHRSVIRKIVYQLYSNCASSIFTLLTVFHAICGQCNLLKWVLLTRRSAADDLALMTDCTDVQADLEIHCPHMAYDKVTAKGLVIMLLTLIYT